MAMGRDDKHTIYAGTVDARHGGFGVHCDIGGSAVGIAAYPAGGPYTSGNALRPIGISGTQINGATLVYYDLSV